MTGYESPERKLDYENFLFSHEQLPSSYDVTGGPKDQERAFYGTVEACNNERVMHGMSPDPQIGSNKGSSGETNYLTVRRRQPSGRYPMRSSAQVGLRNEDFRQESENACSERSRSLDRASSFCLATESKNEDNEPLGAASKKIMGFDGNDQVTDEPLLEKLTNTRDTSREDCSGPSLSLDDKKYVSSMDISEVEHSSLSSSVNGRKFAITTIEVPNSNPENQLKEMTTQQKKRILLNSSSDRYCSDVNPVKKSHLYGSPERCGLSVMQILDPREEEQRSNVHSSGLPRSTSNRDSIGGESTLYRSASIWIPVGVQIDGKRKSCDGGSYEINERDESNRNSFGNVEEEDHKLSYAQTGKESQRPSQVNVDYVQPSLASESRFLNDPNKINEAAYYDYDNKDAQSSIAYELVELPSPTVNVELKRKVEELERLVADERKKFQVVTERLAEQQIEAEKNSLQMQDDWEGRIRELQKEKYSGSIRLQSTETAHLASLLPWRESQAQPTQSILQTAQKVKQPANGSAPQRRVSIHRYHEDFLKELEADQARENSGRASQVTDQEAKKLRQEILQQEILIRGYQRENEKALQKIKEVQAEAKEKVRIMTEENVKLKNELVHCQHRCMAAGHQAATKLSLHEAMDRELQLKEISRLKDELVKAHADLEQREKRVSKTLDDPEAEIEKLKNRLAEERESHARTTASREGITKSLVEKQHLLTSLQSTHDQQAVQILELSSKVAHYEGQGGHLNKIVKQDRETLSEDKRSASVDDRSLRRAKKPESGLSVANFGISTLAVTKDESEKIRKLQMQIAVLKKQKHKEDESNKRLNILKDELEKSKQEYEKRLQHLQAFHPNIEPDFGNDQVSQSRVKALESQVVNIRIHNARKLKELTDKLAESKTEQNKLKVALENAAHLKNIPPNRTVKVKELKDLKERICVLQDVLDHKDHTIENLQHKLELSQTEANDAAAPGFGLGAASSTTIKQTAILSKTKKFAECSYRKIISRGLDRRSYSVPLERENRRIPTRIKRLPEKLESTQAQVQKANAATATPYLLVLNGIWVAQVEVIAGCHRNTHKQTSATASKEIHCKGHIFSEVKSGLLLSAYENRLRFMEVHQAHRPYLFEDISTSEPVLSSTSYLADHQMNCREPAEGQ
nr:centrosomal protein of 162 kDa-like isoform X5 [Physcomitrium patens]|eukprot:XP_024375591.1 centrosomal protein of 162 kDa-like isoform X5 [Physcomitrella patens]